MCTFEHFACWVNFHVLQSSRIAIKESNGLDPDQDQLSVGSDLGPNCLQGYQEATNVNVHFTLRLT